MTTCPTCSSPVAEGETEDLIERLDAGLMKMREIAKDAFKGRGAHD